MYLKGSKMIICSTNIGSYWNLHQQWSMQWILPMDRTWCSQTQTYKHYGLQLSNKVEILRRSERQSSKEPGNSPRSWSCMLPLLNATLMTMGGSSIANESGYLPMSPYTPD
jgi:hypothetical protein